MEEDKGLEPFAQGKSGELASKDPETFKAILVAVVEHFQLTSPFEHAIANRVAAAWMMLQHAEKLLAKHGLIHMVNKEGASGPIPKVSEIAYYKNQLEKEFRSYFNMLTRAKKQGDSGDKEDMVDLSAAIEASLGKKEEKTSRRKKGS